MSVSTSPPVTCLNDKWSFVANVGYKQLLGDAKDSPLVRLRGDKDQFIVRPLLFIPGN